MNLLYTQEVCIVEFFWLAIYHAIFQMRVSESREYLLPEASSSSRNSTHIQTAVS